MSWNNVFLAVILVDILSSTNNICFLNQPPVFFIAVNQSALIIKPIGVSYTVSVLYQAVLLFQPIVYFSLLVWMARAWHKPEARTLLLTNWSHFWKREKSKRTWMATEVLRLFVRAGAGSGICNMILTEKKKKRYQFSFWHACCDYYWNSVKQRS